MQTGITHQEQMRQQRCCVIIPTYNNDGTIERVIRGVEEYCDDIIIVNDGSTDRTAAILEQFGNHHVVNIPSNRGKGNALQTGFKKALELGFSHAITIDSDGQHFPEDIPAFIRMSAGHPGSLIVGARDMDQAGIPGGSSFGHRFSVFWFRVETGLRIPDVQTGYRLYPLEKIRDIRFYTSKYEFEVEALVRSAWKGIRILSVPVKVYYAPEGERVSHFRKYRDFGRTSILNTILVLWAFIWVKPYALFRFLKRKSWKELFREHVLNNKDSNLKISASVALGATFSSLPIWGWQMVASVAVAYVLRLNKFITLVFSNLSIPPMIPFIIFFSHMTGGWVMGKNISEMKFDGSVTLKWIEQNLVQYLIGSVVFSVLLGLCLGTAAFLLLSLFRRRKVKEQST